LYEAQKETAQAQSGVVRGWKAGDAAEKRLRVCRTGAEVSRYRESSAADGRGGPSAFCIEMRPQVRFGDEPQGLPVDRAQCPLIYFVMENNGKSLPGSRWQDSPQLYVTTALGGSVKPKTLEKIRSRS